MNKYYISAKSSGYENHRFTDSRWLMSISKDFNLALEIEPEHVVLDLSNIDHVTMYEWISIVSHLDLLASKKGVKQIDIDIIGFHKNKNEILLNPVDYLKYEKTVKNRGIIPPEIFSSYNNSNRVYTLAGFIESLGTLDTLKSQTYPSYKANIIYPGLSSIDAKIKAWYTDIHNKNITTVLGLKRIQKREKNDCLIFLDESQIHNWRIAMKGQYEDANIFKTDEFWNIICHELAINIYEHAKISGFMVARVVRPFNSTGKIKSFWSNYYDNTINKCFEESKSQFDITDYKELGFLELCVADSGPSFFKTLKDSYEYICGYPISKSNSLDILSFAFDKLGTRKNNSDRWLGDRHALWRILNIVNKYQGLLRIRSFNEFGGEITYSTINNPLKLKRLNEQHERYLVSKDKIIPRSVGYIPDHKRDFNSWLNGSQLQILIPLLSKQRHDISKTSVLIKSLPDNFYVDTNHAKGHLIPLKETLDFSDACAGLKDQKLFKNSCIKLAEYLHDNHPDEEPFVFDFSDLTWTSAQIETLLELFHTLISERPVLLVELSPNIAKQLEDEIDTRVYSFEDEEQNNDFYNTTELRKFLNDYSKSHIPVLALDQNGEKYFLGIYNTDCRNALKKLIVSKSSNIIGYSIDEIASNNSYYYIIDNILHAARYLFINEEDNLWRVTWYQEELNTEARRIISKHFDEISLKCEAWRSKSSTRNNIFKIPWEMEWYKDYFELTRIFSRERYLNEISQRLIYRLKHGLNKINSKLDDVEVLVGLTAPDMVLATSIRRWWPIQSSKPVVVDLGYNALLKPTYSLPSNISSNSIVLVRAFMHKGNTTLNILNNLKEFKSDILCILNFVRMQTTGNKTNASECTNIDSGWDCLRINDIHINKPIHSMIIIPSPDKAENLKPNESDKDAWWVEPRSLRPIRYPTLRREFPKSRDPDFVRRLNCLELMDNSYENNLLLSGHYTFSMRHYLSCIDIRKFIEGPIGKRIAYWLANVCIGNSFDNKNIRTEKEFWESDHGFDLRGDVSIVLIPLHSQIHYIWPLISNRLAEKGRRQPMFLMDATLFPGHGTSYQIPRQFQYQLDNIYYDIIKHECHSNINKNITNKEIQKKQLRILVIDDSFITGRTLDTIFSNLMKEIDDSFRRIIEKYNILSESWFPNELTKQIKNGSRKSLKDIRMKFSNPISWIRIFCIFDQTSNSKYRLLREYRSIGKPPIDIIFEDFAPFMGIPIYSQDDCPVCNEIHRLKYLENKCEDYGEFSALKWLKKRINSLLPETVQNPISKNISENIILPKPICPLGTKRPKINDSPLYYPKYSGSAIWLFYNYMHYAYPPSDALYALDEAWHENSVDDKKIINEYEKYRWAVFDWCIRNWSRVKADGAQYIFFEKALEEIRDGTSNLEKIIVHSSVNYNDQCMIEFLQECLKIILELEVQYVDFKSKRENKLNEELSDNLSSLLVRVIDSISLFLLSIPMEFRNEFENQTVYKIIKRREYANLDESLLLSQRLIMSSGKRDPKWSLNMIAESLFRGWNPHLSQVYGHGTTLPAILKKVKKHQKQKYFRLLLASLPLFINALRDLRAYAMLEIKGAAEILELSEKVLSWAYNYDETSEDDLKSLENVDRLFEALDPKRSFCKSFNQAFHIDVLDLEEYMIERKNDVDKKNMLNFQYILDNDIQHCYILTHVERFIRYLSNYTIDRIEQYNNKSHISRIEVKRTLSPRSENLLTFRLLTSYDSPEITNHLTNEGKGTHGEYNNLESFGVIFSEKWIEPTVNEKSEGFTSTYELSTITGYIRK